MADKKKANTYLYPEFADKTEVVEKVKKKTGEVVRELKTTKRPLKYDADHNPKTIEVRLKNLHDYEQAVKSCPPPKIQLHEQIQYEKDNLGYAVTVWEGVNPSFALVTGIDNIKFTPKVQLYQISTGKEFVAKVNKKLFWSEDEPMLYIGDVIKVIDMGEEDGWKKDGNKWVRNPNVQELHLYKAKLMRPSNKRA